MRGGVVGFDGCACRKRWAERRIADGGRGASVALAARERVLRERV